MSTNTPKFIIFCGPMMSSKTTRLLAAIDRFKYQNKKVVAFKPKIDSRYTTNEICTHSGGRLEAFVVSNGSDVFKHVIENDPDIIAVDEAFMIDGVADVLIDFFRRGKTIIVSSIELSSSCNVFSEIEKMLPWATDIQKCTAVCVMCENDAPYTHRKIENINEIVVGGSEIYEPRCWQHHSNIQLKD